MRVLLISTNREVLPDPVAPLGAAYVGAALKLAGHEVRLLDLMFSVDPVVSIRDACRTFKPQVAGLSIRNVDNVAFPECVSYIPELASAVRALRASGVRFIVAGGSGFTIMPIEIMEALGLNLGVVGEGEEAFPELLLRAEKGLPVNTIPGLAYRFAGKLHVNSSRKIGHLDHSPMPDRGMLENSLYLSEGGSGNLQTKRGCAYSCVYCTYPIVEGKNVRLKSPALAAAEFEYAVKDHGLKHIFIVDNVFNNPPEHAKSFCRELISRGNTAGWSCYLNPRGVDAELVELMSRSGCKGVEFGTDSAVDSVLSELKKGFKSVDIVNASRLCSEAGLSYCHSLLFGGPGETSDTVSRTLDVMDIVKPNAVIGMLGIRVFPGTSLAARAEKEGLLSGPLGLEPFFYFSPKMEIEPVSRCLASYGRTHTNFIMPGVHLRMTDKIRQRLRAYGFLGPLWEYLRG